MGSSRKEARTRARAAARPAAFAGFLGALVALALLPAVGAPRPARAAAHLDLGDQEDLCCNVPTGTIAGYEVRQWYASVPNPTPGGGFITHMETDIVDADTGAQVPIQRLMLHHIVFTNLNRQDSTCAGRATLGCDNARTSEHLAPQRFYAAGEERAKMSLPDGYGYAPVTATTGDRGDGDEPPLHRRPRLHPLRGDDRLQSRPEAVTPYWLDVRNCRANPIYNVPSIAQKAKRAKKRKGSEQASAARKHKKGKHRKKHKKKAAGRPPTRRPTTPWPQSGYLIAGGGHIHGGAIGGSSRAELRKPPGGRVQSDMGPARPSLLQRQTDAAQARADQHECLQRHDRAAGAR